MTIRLISVLALCASLTCAQTSTQSVKSGKKHTSAKHDIGSGAGDVGKGAGKAVGSAAKGTGKAAADLVTLHPISKDCARNRQGSQAYFLIGHWMRKADLLRTRARR